LTLDDDAKPCSDQFDLEKSTATTTTTSSSSSSSPTRRFVLDPSHPFYWHLSNRENRPQSPNQQQQQSPTTTRSPTLVIKKVKQKRRNAKKRKRVNYTKTSHLTSNAHHHANTARPSALAKSNLNRRQMRRAS